MRSLNSLMIFVLMMSMVLAACVEENEPLLPTTSPVSPKIEIVDGLGRTVTLDVPAQRVVSMAPSNTEILFAIGAEQQTVGRDDFSDYPANAIDLPSIGSAFGNYNLEIIAELQPDLVLAAQINTPEQVQAIEKLGFKVFYLSNPTDLENLFVNLETVGKLTGRDSEAEALVNTLRSRVNVVLDGLKNVTTIPLVYYELDATDPSKPWTPGPNTFLTKMIIMAGGHAIGESLSSDYAQINLEFLLTQNPDIILLGDAAYGTTPESVAQRTGWESLTAVANGFVYPFDDNLVSRPGPRLVDGLEQLAGMIHPEVFAK